MYILGIACYGAHDSAVALMRDGQLISAVEEERFSRVKHDRSFPYNSLSYCLAEAGISINDIDHIGYFWKPLTQISRNIFNIIKQPKSLASLLFSKQVGKKDPRIKRVVQMLMIERLLRSEYQYRNKFYFLDHHLCHAASTCFSSGFDEAAILSIDGNGEYASTLYGCFEGNRLSTIKKINFPQSLGFMYGAVTQYLGFRYNNDEYKVMGLSPYSKGSCNKTIEKLITYKGNGDYQLDLSFFDFPSGSSRWYSEKMITEFGPARLKDEPIVQRHMDIAGGLQLLLETVVLNMLAYLKETTCQKNLCLAGGVALNSAMNGKIRSSGIFDQVFVFPAANDAGTSVGAAKYIHNIILKNKKPKEKMNNAYLGPDYSDHEIEKAITDKNLDYVKSENIERETAKQISEQKVVAWFQGRMEFGPRALGNRSIVADPRIPEMKDIINAKIKFREFFRPFAPSVLEEKTSEYFMINGDSPFMLFVCQVAKDKGKIIPAVTHADNSARVHTVDKKVNPKYWNLINEFYTLTGVPVILNTSMNINREPIVNTPEEAVNCFLKTDIDCLVMNNFLLIKKI